MFVSHSVVGDIVVGTDFRVFYPGKLDESVPRGIELGTGRYTDGLNRVPEGTRSGV